MKALLENTQWTEWSAINQTRFLTKVPHLSSGRCTAALELHQISWYLVKQCQKVIEMDAHIHPD